MEREKRSLAVHTTFWSNLNQEEVLNYIPYSNIIIMYLLPFGECNVLVLYP